MTLGLLMTQRRFIRYIAELVGSHISRNPSILWLAGAVMSEVEVVELAILWLASTVMGEVDAHDGGEGHAPVGQEDKTIGQKRYCND